MNGSFTVLTVCAVLVAGVFASSCQVFAKSDGLAGEATNANAAKEIQALREPGEGHEIFAALSGMWNYTMTVRETPDAAPIVSTGTSNNKRVLDSRFLQLKSEGKVVVNGKEENFEGRGFMGFDNVKQHYDFVWMDNLGTTMGIGHGVMDVATKTINGEGVYSDPVKGAEQVYRSALKIINANEYSYTVYVKGDSGKEFPSVEISYKRQK